MMFFYPFRQYTDTTDSMNGLEAVNDIFDAVSLTAWHALRQAAVAAARHAGCSA
jgi:hypothetical protein